MKISIIGAGQVGAALAQQCLIKKLGKQIVLLDIASDIAKGKALDLNVAGPIFGSPGSVKGTGNYEDISDSDLVVLTAGFPRKDGMTRRDLLQKNAGVVSEVAENVKKYSPESTVIVATNPLDVMSYLFFKRCGIKKNRIIGMAGILDTARFIHYLSEELNIPGFAISSLVLGTHGETMVPVIESIKVNNKPLGEALSKEKILEIVERTRQGGAEVIRLLKGSAYVAPAAAIVRMVEAIMSDKKEVYPSSVYLEGEYGYNDIFLGVPARLGKNGVEEIVEIPLSPETKEQLDVAAEAVKKGIEELKKLVL